MKTKKYLKSIFEKQVISRYLRRYNYHRKDLDDREKVHIVGFPKSGNTWMQNQIAGVQFGINPAFMSDALAQELVPPVKQATFYREYGNFTCFKSHELPHGSYEKVILLVRDGRDVMLSYEVMNKKMGVQYSLSDMVMEGRGLYPCKWGEFYSEWTRNPYNSSIHIVKYEDMINKPVDILKGLCDFLALDRDYDLLRAVSSGNSIGKMKTREEQFGAANVNWPGTESFFGAGKAGSYKKSFDPLLLEYFESESLEQLQKFGYIGK